LRGDSEAKLTIGGYLPGIPGQEGAVRAHTAACRKEDLNNG